MLAAAVLLLIAEGAPWWAPVASMVIAALVVAGGAVKTLWLKPAVSQAEHTAALERQRADIDAAHKAIAEHRSSVGGELQALLRRADACDARHADIRVAIARVEERQESVAEKVDTVIGMLREGRS